MMLFGGKDEEKKPVKKEQTVKTAAPKAFSNDGLMGKGTGGYDVLIGKNTVINGNISVQGCTRIDGYIEGTLAVDNMLHIGESGVVNMIRNQIMPLCMQVSARFRKSAAKTASTIMPNFSIPINMAMM